MAPRRPRPDAGEGKLGFATGKFSSSKPQYKYVKFHDLFGNATEIRDPIVLVMNTSDREDEPTPFLPGLKLPRLPDVEFPNIDKLLETFKGQMEANISNILSAEKLKEMMGDAAEAALEAMPEVDATLMGENLRETIATLLPTLDLPSAEGLETRFGELVGDLLDGVDFEIPEFKDELLERLDDLLGKMPTAGEIKKMLRKTITGSKTGSVSALLWGRDQYDSETGIFKDILAVTLDKVFDQGDYWIRTPLMFKFLAVFPDADKSFNVSVLTLSGVKTVALRRTYDIFNSVSLSIGEVTNQAWSNSRETLTDHLDKLGLLDDWLDDVADQIAGQFRLTQLLSGIALDADLVVDYDFVPTAAYAYGLAAGTLTLTPIKNIAYLFHQLLEDLGDKLDGLLDTTLIPLIEQTAGKVGFELGEILNAKFIPVLEDIAEEIGKELGNLWNSLITGEALSGSFVALGEKIGEALAGLMENKDDPGNPTGLVPHIQDAVLMVTEYILELLESQWKDNIDPQFVKIDEVFDDLQNNIDNLGGELIKYIKDKLFKPIITPVQNVKSDGFEVWTKGTNERTGQPAEGRYIAFSGSFGGLPDFGDLLDVGERVEGITDYVKGLREKFEAPFQR